MKKLRRCYELNNSSSKARKNQTHIPKVEKTQGLPPSRLSQVASLVISPHKHTTLT